MAPTVLERESELSTLADSARRAAAGSGCVVLVSGEAGIGKSSLVEAARSRIPAEGRLLVGHCDDLSTPRVLGPFRDLIGSVGTELSKALRDGADRDATVSALHHELDWPGHPTILAIEDVHWADEATLDVLRYLVRRVSDLPVVLLLTYRDDGLSRAHPLRQLLGLAATIEGTRRLQLRRLSHDAVEALSAAGSVDVDAIYDVTGGNPFFVHEVLTQGPEGGVPQTVVDAVLARLRRLDPLSRDAIERLSVIPSSLDRSLVDALVPGGIGSLSTAEEHGLLSVKPTRVAFRHELTRRAIVDALPTARRTALNGDVLAVLEGLGEDEGADPASLVHHAAEAGDQDAIVEHGPRAAKYASSRGAHREAADYYKLVLAYPDAFGIRELADLLEGSAVESYTAGDRGRSALDDQEACVELRRRLDDLTALGISLRWLSRIRWWCGERAAADAAGDECVRVVEATGDNRLLAWAMSNQAQLAMLAHRTYDAVAIAKRAVDFARRASDTPVLVHALNNLGTAMWVGGDRSGRALVEESLAMSREAGQTEEASRAYVNLIWELLISLEPAEADRIFAVGIEYLEDSEQLVFSQYMYVEKGMIENAASRWDDAITYASRGLDAPDPIRCAALIAIGRAMLRSGMPADEQLNEAWRLARNIDELQRTAPAAGVMCEAAWLRGDHEAIRAIARPVYDKAAELNATHDQPELAYWLTMVGERVEIGDYDHPYNRLANGDWRGAADMWGAAGYPFEEAHALSHSDDPDVVLDALARLDALGATAMARLVRVRLRDLGVVRVPRGPLTSTRDNVAGLTERQLQVLRYVAQGMSSADIADQLVVSVRTVDNHVAAMLQKLGAHSRANAVERAIALGWAAN